MLCFSLLRGPEVVSYSTKAPQRVLAKELVIGMQEMNHTGFTKTQRKREGILNRS